MPIPMTPKSNNNHRQTDKQTEIVNRVQREHTKAIIMVDVQPHRKH